MPLGALQPHSPEWGSRARELRSKCCSNPNSTETGLKNRCITRQKHQMRKKIDSAALLGGEGSLLTGFREGSGKGCCVTRCQELLLRVGPMSWGRSRGAGRLTAILHTAGWKCSPLRSSLPEDSWQDRCVVASYPPPEGRLAVTRDRASRTSRGPN